MINMITITVYFDVLIKRCRYCCDIVYKYCTYPVSDMLSFHNGYASRPLNKRKLDCNHNFAITVMQQFADYKLRV